MRAPHRERHLRALGPHSELVEEPEKQWVVPLVVDEEARVELEGFAVRPMGDGARVPARVPGLLEDLHVVSAREEIGRSKAGDTGSDDCNLHEDFSVCSTEPAFAYLRSSVVNKGS